ncbi:uncharacterized protein LOC132039355 [Lycium ferocissimum]|uniref:uncharacterized protein LOC132039355 n=1 Tax=Lycium ferocissimum TaxID=112874 RepID=UPI002815EAD7|nr:uncharacterized protein LOC132039355 [Lycium ferocissimum]
MTEETTPVEITAGSQTRNTVTIDSTHPYYLHSLDGPGMNLVNCVFDGKGFPGWRRSVLIAFSAKKKLGFINRCCKIPDLDSTDYPLWSCYNYMVTAWLLNSLSKDIRDSVIYSKTAKELWDSLELRFGKSNGAKLFHLQKELNTSVQGNSDISGYFTKLKRLWDELDSLNSYIVCTCPCTCEGKAKMSKFLQDQRMIHFLMGLNDVYAQARGNILMMNPLPAMDYAYSLLLQDENQREIYVNAQVFSKSASFMVTNQGKMNQKPTNQYYRNANGPQKTGIYPQRFGNSQQKHKGKRSKFNPNVSCTHCFKIGHVIDGCHRLHGYQRILNLPKGRTISLQ